MKCKKLLSCMFLVLCFLLYQGQQSKSYALTISTQDAQAIIDTQVNKCYVIEGTANTTNYNIGAQTSRIIDPTSLATTLNEIINYYETTYNYTLDYDNISILWRVKANSDYGIYADVYITSSASDFPTGNLWLRVDDYTTNNNKVYYYYDNTDKYPFYWEMYINKTTGIVTKASKSGEFVSTRNWTRFSSSFTSNNSGETWQKSTNKTISGDKYYWGGYLSLSPAQFVASTNAYPGSGTVTYILNGNNAGLLSPTPSGDTPSGDTPSGDTPSGDTPSGDTPSGDTPSGDTPSGEQSGDQSYAGLINAINNQNTDYWGTSGDLTIDTQSGEINQALNETINNLSGELADNEIISTLKTAERGILDIFEYGKDNPLGLDFIVSWDTVTYNGNILIPSGEINFSKNVREIPILSTIMAYVRTILSFWCAWALIVQIYNLLLSTLGIDNPYLYENVRETDIVNAYTGEANTVYTKTKRLYRWWK